MDLRATYPFLYLVLTFAYTSGITYVIYIDIHLYIFT